MYTCIDAPLVEPVAVNDIIIKGIALVEEVAPGLRRLTCYVKSTCTFDGRPERKVVARIVISDDDIHENIVMLAGAIPKHASLVAANS